MHRNLDILVVQREATTASAVASALQKRGHHVRVAHNAEEALDLPTPDVLVSDIELGGLTGIELLAWYCQGDEPPRTVFLSSTPRLEDCREAMRLGATEFLTKPFRLDDLVHAVEARGTDSSSPVGGSTDWMHTSYPAESASVTSCARDLSAFALRAGIGPTCRARIASACCEIIDNVVRHAYPHRSGTIEVEASMEGRECSVTIRDEGVGVGDREDVSACMESPLHNGLARAAALCEGIDVHSPAEGGTLAELTFSAYRVDFDDSETVDLSELDYFTPDTAREVLKTVQVDDAGDILHLSPALAVLVGRLLAGTDPRKILSTALWS